jgi:hypothetical protein
MQAEAHARRRRGRAEVSFAFQSLALELAFSLGESTDWGVAGDDDSQIVPSLQNVPNEAQKADRGRGSSRLSPPDHFP